MNRLIDNYLLKQLIPILLILFIGCSTKNKSAYNIAIIKFATHPALDEVENNFIITLNSLLSDVNIIKLNAHGDPVTAKLLAESVTKPSTNLIVSLATPATQAVSKTTSNIPLLFGAVSDPVGANIEWIEQPG